MTASPDVAMLESPRTAPPMHPAPIPRLRVALAALFAVASVVTGLGCTSGSVVRVVDGVVVPHRFISGRAYAAYARGVYAEARGRYADAVTAFVEAGDADPRGVEPRTRLGAVSCRLEHFSAADKAFDEALERDATFEPLWREKALCDIQRSDLKAAVRDSERAEELDPEREETILLHVDVLERVGDAQGALREVMGLTTRRPSPSAWRRQLGVAERAGDEPAARLARLALALHPDASVPAVSSRSDRLALVDHLLRAGDESAAEQVGRAARLSPPEVVVRAAALGASGLALDRGERILAAEPSSGDAFVAAIVGADLARDEAKLEQLIERARHRELAPPSALGRLLLLELLARRTGPEALEGADLGADAKDPLEAAVAARLLSKKAQR